MINENCRRTCLHKVPTDKKRVGRGGVQNHGKPKTFFERAGNNKHSLIPLYTQNITARK